MFLHRRKKSLTFTFGLNLGILIGIIICMAFIARY